MDPNELSILVRALDGEWETLGSESARYRGAVPENVQFSADPWGSSTCSFELRRHPGALHPDLAAFTECEIWVAGFKCWSGRVKETPTREGPDPIISVQGQGWQYHLDDDLYKRTYARSRLDGWTDMRSSLTATLGETAIAAVGQVSVDGSALTLMYPNGAPFWAGATVGCYLDLGPEPASWARAVNVTFTTSNNTAGVLLYVRGSSGGPDNTFGWAPAQIDDIINSPLSTLGAGPFPYYANLSAPRRWLQLFLHFPAGTGAVTGADHWAKFSLIDAFSDPTYHSSGTSVLKADMVVRDAASKATVKLSNDLSRISAGTFDIPEFEMSGYQTPREVITAVNAFENFETKVDVDRRMVFAPRRTAPIYEIGEWSGAEFEDASANSGEEVINRVIVQGSAAGGVPLSVERWSSGTTTAMDVPQVSNPSAAVNTSGWTGTVSSGVFTLARTTASFQSAPASFDVSGGLIYNVSTSLPAMDEARYRVSMYVMNPSGSNTSSAQARVETTAGVVAGFGPLVTLPISSPWTRIYADFRVHAGESYLFKAQVQRSFLFDDVRVERHLATVVDRQGFTRTRVMPIQNRVTDASAARLGDLYLEQHRATPFTGGFKATGVGGVRRVLGGGSTHPAWLAKDVGELVRVSHVIDPDTGAIGRDERIAGVSYDHNALTATVSLSEDRGGFDALLQRLAVVVK